MLYIGYFRSINQTFAVPLGIGIFHQVGAIALGGLERVAALKHEVFWDDENGIRSFGMLGRKGKIER